MAASPPDTVRAFIAIDPPDFIKTRVTAFQHELKSALKIKSIRWTQPEQVHATLKFLGHLAAECVAPVETALRQVCGRVAPFDLGIAGSGCFPEPARPRTVWVGINGALDTLSRLQEQIDAATAAWTPKEDRTFHPHLTIARIRHANAREAKALQAALGKLSASLSGSWPVKTIELMRSEPGPQGARYSFLANIPLLSHGPGRSL